MFLILTFVIATVCSVITIKVLAGYNPEFSWKLKFAIAVIVTFSWFAPVFINLGRRYGMSGTLYAVFSQTLYVLFGTAFILICLLLLRDAFWLIGYKIAGWMGHVYPSLDPMSPVVLKKANIITVAITFSISFYALYEGTKFPAVKKTTLNTSKISEPFKIVAMTDLHITQGTRVKRIERIVKKVNKLNPDIVVLVGDIVDTQPRNIAGQMNALAGLKAKYGVFITHGNHEAYVGSAVWEGKFQELGFKFFAIKGEMIGDTNVYVAGIQDHRAFRIGEKTLPRVHAMLHQKDEGAYTVFLSHSPQFVKNVNSDEVDLQISGHTHGGQIFPFHFLVKRFNEGFLSGLYNVNGVTLYISNGTHGWGPSMRLFAPSEISEITLTPESID